jgi:hypothetical protein
MSDYHYQYSANTNVDAAYYSIWLPLERVLTTGYGDPYRGDRQTSAAEDYAELEAAWPTLEDCEDGVDVFPWLPIAGKEEPPALH